MTLDISQAIADAKSGIINDPDGVRQAGDFDPSDTRELEAFVHYIVQETLLEVRTEGLNRGWYILDGDQTIGGASVFELNFAVGPNSDSIFTVADGGAHMDPTNAGDYLVWYNVTVGGGSGDRDIEFDLKIDDKDIPGSKTRLAYNDDEGVHTVSMGPVLVNINAQSVFQLEGEFKAGQSGVTVDADGTFVSFLRLPT